MTPIYDRIPQSAKSECGYFTPKCAHRIFDSFNSYVHKGSLSRKKQIDYETRVLYYPGSFGSFHAGHLSVIWRAIEQVAKVTDNYVVVVAPANSDYVAEKYGEWSVRASNKRRYDNIKQHMFTQRDMWIDLNPMLNNPCDYNIDTQVEQFLQAELKCGIKDMVHPPMVLCGKDRDFSKITDYQGYLDVFFADDSTGFSTSKTENELIEKKDLILRVHNYAQFDLFCKYFSKHYKSIKPQLIGTEKFVAQEYARMNGIRYTNCKDYADFLIYIPLSRKWINPLEHSGFDGDEWHFNRISGQKVLDSDCFTGSTADHLQRKYNIDSISLVDLSDRDDVELLDIDDFYTWQYPYVDISYRCSMPAFSAEDHLYFADFVKELKGIPHV